MAKKFSVGDLEVLVVSDGTVAFPGTAYFAGTTEAQWAEHKRWLNHEGQVVFEFGCFLVKSGDRSVLIDTGVGPVKIGPFSGGALLGDLASGGVHPEEIDTVFMTHLHIDHVGSSATKVNGEMRVSFPKATYRWTGDEQEYWHTGEGKDAPTLRRDVLGAIASRYEAADAGTSLAPGVDVIAMPGHTPGHAGVVLSSGDARAFILGDAISCPVQLEETEWSGLGDVDPKLARRNQEALAKEIEGTGALLGASHFPGLNFGRVLVGSGRRYWEPL